MTFEQLLTFYKFDQLLVQSTLKWNVKKNILIFRMSRFYPRPISRSGRWNSNSLSARRIIVSPSWRNNYPNCRQLYNSWTDDVSETDNWYFVFLFEMPFKLIMFKLSEQKLSRVVLKNLQSPTLGRLSVRQDRVWHGKIWSKHFLD